jgi:hypothetical protein
MAIDKPSKIDNPESIESYKVTLFWGLTIKQVVLLFIATLFVGFGVFSLTGHRPVASAGMFIMTALTLVAMTEVRGRNFYRHLLFIFSYYKSKPQVLIYHHYTNSGQSAFQTKQLVYQKENNGKILTFIILGIILGLTLLTLTGIYIYHVIHK